MGLFSINWYQILMFFMNQQDTMFDTSIYIGLGSSILFTLCFLFYYKIIMNASFRDKDVKFWVFFLIKRGLVVLCSIPFDFVAVGILGYTVLICGQMLRSKSEKKHYFLYFFGFLLSPLVYILGIIGFTLTLFGIFGGEPLMYDLAGLLVSGGIFFLFRSNFPIKQTLEEFERYMSKHGWSKIPKKLKATLVIMAVCIPTFLFTYSYHEIYPPNKTIMLEMSDGVHLKTKIYFPKDWDKDPKPVVLIRTPYNLENLFGYVSMYTLTQGYITVVQDLRGTYGSEGLFIGFLMDYRDGNETVNWIMNQAWCNGKIASAGGSALAINQICYHPSLINPINQGLRAASILVGTSEIYEYCTMPGGCVRQGLLENWMIPVSGIPDVIEQLLVHPTKDSFWDTGSLRRNDRYKNIDVRALHLGGWYDMFCQGSLDTFNLYNQGTDYAKDHQFLVMGPWSHGISYNHLDIQYPDTGNIGLSYYYLLENALFNEYLGDNSTIGDWNAWPRVYYYVMGDPDGSGSGTDYNAWRTANAWPVANTPEAWYLYPDGNLWNSTPGIGEQLYYLYNPKYPVRNGGGTTLTLEYIGAVDQRRVEYETYYNNKYTGPFDTSHPRADILKFTSPVLTSPVEIIGNITAELYITSNCTDTDFTAKLIDVFPDGREMWIAEGILKARYRNAIDFQTEELMDGSGTTVYSLNIDMWSTAYRFTEGHRIRLSISSSNYNKFALNPNTGGPVTRMHPEDCTQLGTNYYIANNSVSCGIGGSMSCLWLPRTL